MFYKMNTGHTLWGWEITIPQLKTKSASLVFSPPNSNLKKKTTNCTDKLFHFWNWTWSLIPSHRGMLHITDWGAAPQWSFGRSTIYQWDHNGTPRDHLGTCWDHSGTRWDYDVLRFWRTLSKPFEVLLFPLTQEIVPNPKTRRD